MFDRRTERRLRDGLVGEAGTEAMVENLVGSGSGAP